jgi:type 1 fimbria pilin
MRAHILFAIPIFAILSSGCGGGDASGLSAPGEAVQAPLRLVLAADALAVGTSSTGTITLSEPARDDGVAIALASSDDSSVAVPLTITVAPGEHTATFVFTNSYEGRPRLVWITANSEDAKAEASLYVPRMPPEPPACKTHACTR